MAKWLTKSDYLRFLIHPAYLWLGKYDKDKLPPFDEGGQFNVDQGNEVERYARELFPDGILIDVPLFDKAEKTAEILRSSPSTSSGNNLVLFQGSVLTERKLFAAADILVKRGDSWDLYEVKSSARVKFDHINDLAFQKTAFTEAGIKIAKTHVVYINNQYTREGDIEPKKLLRIKDVTDKVEAILAPTREKIDQAVEVLKLKDCPDHDPTTAGNLGAWLVIYRLLHPELESDSIYYLKRINPDQLRRLGKMGITRTSQIPLTFKLIGSQRAYLEVLRLARPAVHHLKIKHWLDHLEYPLYFLDYETFNTAVPLWYGQRPYQQLPFQYSLHVLDRPGGQLTQKEFLARGSSDPLPQLLSRLREDLGPAGSILVWFKEFEMGCHDRMAVLHPQFQEFLHDLNTRVEDLMEVFSKLWYVDPAFGGSNSIKNVLPVLVPEMNYKGLGIQKGDMAQVRWTRAARGELSIEDSCKVYADLVEYCGQDTLAMVKIYDVLVKAVTEPRAGSATSERPAASPGVQTALL